MCAGHIPLRVAGAQIPLLPINHIQAHALSARLECAVEYPFLSLVISGGHTALMLAEVSALCVGCVCVMFGSDHYL